MTIDILSLTDAWKPVNGFPQPDWQQIQDHILRIYPERDQPAAWDQATLQWVSAIRHVLDPEYNFYYSDHFIILTTRPDPYAQNVINVCEGAFKNICTRIGVPSLGWTHGRHAIFWLEDMELYDRYISQFDPDVEDFIPSGGFLRRQAYCHAVLHPMPDPFSSIVQELTLLSLSTMDIPRWVAEGLTATMESYLKGKTEIVMRPDMMEFHDSYWNTETIQPFWSGELFDDDEYSGTACTFAEILIHNLEMEFPQLDQFIQDARSSDAGEASAQRHFNKGLGAIAAAFLGDGDWKPRSFRLAPTASYAPHQIMPGQPSTK